MGLPRDSRARPPSAQTEATAHFEAAQADYREVLERDPGGRFRYALLVNRGLVRLQSRKLAEAVADLKEAIALNPRQFNAYVTLAQIERREHRLDLALEHLGRAIALNPDLAPPLSDPRSLAPRAPGRDPAVRIAALADLEDAIQTRSNRQPRAGEGFRRERTRADSGQAVSTGSRRMRRGPSESIPTAPVHRWRVDGTPGAEAISGRHRLV